MKNRFPEIGWFSGAASLLLVQPANAQVPTVWEATQYFQYNIDTVAVGVDPATGKRNVSVVFSVTDPTLPGQPWNIKADAPFTQPASLSRLAIDVGWSTTSYSNTGAANEALLPIPWGNGAAAALPISINAITRSVAIGDKFLVQAVLPMQAVGSGTVALEGRVAWPTTVNGQQVLGRVPVKSAYRHFAITDADIVPRREVVALSKCQQCHDGGPHGDLAEIPRLSLHGNNRTEELRVCTICHNPNQTDIPYRTTGPEQSVNFATLIHSIHGNKRRQTPYVVMGFGGAVNDYSHVKFPGTPADCTVCHLDANGRGTFELPLAPTVPGTAIATGSVPGVRVDVNPANDLRITPTAAVCSSCHDSEKARSHMSSSRQGGAFGVLQADIDSGRVRERCVDCHGPGRDKGVRKVHQIEEGDGEEDN